MRKVPTAIKIAAPLAGLIIAVAAIVVAVGVLKAWWSMPFSVVKPVGAQPIVFPHDIHVASLGIDCQFCHRTVATDEAASIPPVQQCMFCHQVVSGATEQGKADIARIVAAYQNQEPVNWTRVHRLPDHVQFVHSAHIRFFSEENNIAPSAVCATCHGDVATMKIDIQVRNLKMRDCVDCHRGGYLDYLNADAQAAVREAVNDRKMAPPPTDCFQCHY